MSSIPDILTALKTTLTGCADDIYDYVPDSPTLPCLCVYLESWPYDPTADAVFVVLALAGTVDMQDAQTRLMNWVSDTGETSICAAIDDDNTLGGTVSSTLPFQLRSWRPQLGQDGKRVLYAELELHILR